ncbi:MAG: hypothetical protein ACJ741_13325 [Pyrinomonadaceae bacterium]
MYSVDEQDRVIELQGVPQSSVGAPLPLVISDEGKILLGYLIQDRPLHWDGSSVRSVAPSTMGESLALIEFSRYLSFMFGAPNDEAFSGHPLASRGLHPYAAFRVENSSWLRQHERMNSVHRNHDPKGFEQLNHFVFAFHDSTFECLAVGFEVSEHEGSLESLLPEMLRRLWQ